MKSCCLLCKDVKSCGYVEKLLHDTAMIRNKRLKSQDDNCPDFKLERRSGTQKSDIVRFLSTKSRNLKHLKSS